MKFRKFKVEKTVQESSIIRSLYLKPLDDQPIARFKPGQFIVLKLWPIESEVPLYRNYTLSDRPDADHYRVTIKKEENGLVSKILHERIKPGSIIEISQPIGKFIMDQDSDSPIILLSGGVGITPMLSMLEHLLFTRTSRQVFFIHSSKNSAVQPMAKRLSEIKSINNTLTISIHHSQPLEHEEEGIDFDKQGHITLEDLKEAIPEPKKGIYYLCGPYNFMQAISDMLHLLKVPEHHINYEFFGNGEKEFLLDKVETKHIHPLVVNFVKSNQKVEWINHSDSILTLAESIGLTPTNSCRVGTCATCESRLLEGEISYNPEPFMEAREGHVYICCARPNTDLIIDL